MQLVLGSHSKLVQMPGTHLRLKQEPDRKPDLGILQRQVPQVLGNQRQPVLGRNPRPLKLVPEPQLPLVGKRRRLALVVERRRMIGQIVVGRTRRLDSAKISQLLLLAHSNRSYLAHRTP